MLIFVVYVTINSRLIWRVAQTIHFRVSSNHAGYMLDNYIMYIYIYVKAYISYVTTHNFSITTIGRFHRQFNSLPSLSSPVVLYTGQRVPIYFLFYCLLTAPFSKIHTDGVLSDISCMNSRQTYQCIPSLTFSFLSESLSLWTNCMLFASFKYLHQWESLCRLHFSMHW